MKTKKVLLGSLVLAGVISACTDENVVEGVLDNMPLTERTQVNLTLDVPEVDSRMSAGTGWQSNMETHDVLGAVLVDKGYTASSKTNREWNNVNWKVIDGHVGNNKWAYVEGKFKTEGTTSVGSWLFYTKYNEKMTTTRNGVEFSFPQIQEGSTNLAWVMNNNANFMISPVTHIDGYEGQNLDFTVRITSVFNYLRMPFDMSATQAGQVQKIIVKATDEKGGAKVFPTEYVVINTNLPEAMLSLDAPAGKAIKCPNVEPVSVYDVTDQNAEMTRAYDAMVYQTKNYTSGTGTSAVTNWGQMAADMIASPYIKAVEGHTGVNHLVVDLDGEHADKAGKGGLTIVNGKFSAVMLMPAGVYSSITFDIYTDKGVFSKTVTDNSFYRFNLAEEKQAEKVPAYKKIILRPGRPAVLSDIQGEVEGSNTAETLTAEEYIKVAATDKLTGEQFITKTADLINFINGITTTGVHKVNVMAQDAIGGGANDDETIPEHGVIVNQAVMTAVEAKETKLNGDIQIDLVGATVTVKGNDAAASPLNIHDLTFSDGAKLSHGYVKATSQVIVPTGKKMLVQDGVNLELALANATTEKFNKLEVEDGATVKATTSAAVDNLLNEGTFSIAADKTIASATVENKGTATVEGAWNVSKELTNARYATLTNKGVVTLEGEATNNGTLTNNKDINVQGAFMNYGNVTIAKNAKIHVNSTEKASMINEGTVTNSGMLYTKVGYDNTITNLGTIDSKSGSTTYITKNSKEDESVKATNGNVMGTLKIETRDLDVSVTESNYKGYIQYGVAAADLKEGKFDVAKGDKYNKVILSSATELTKDAAARICYIVTNADLVLPPAAEIQEVTFTGNASLKADDTKANVYIGKLVVNKDVLVKVPTENRINIYDVDHKVSKTTAAIENNGEILVGGNLYTSIGGKDYTDGNGEFSAGDGNATAFHWATNLTDNEGNEETEEIQPEGSEKDGYLMVGNTAVVTSSDGFATVLAMNKKDVVINLKNDVSISIEGNETQINTTGSLTINGGGKTITFDGVTEAGLRTEAKLYINNANITRPQDNSGTWNTHNIHFVCDVEMNNVVSSDALAFGADATLKQVTVMEDPAQDYYGIWIVAKGQTVVLDGCVIDNKSGRGIKIDHQYNEAVEEKVTLKVSNTIFETKNKSAIMVKTVKGADIELSNVDISGVAADKVNAVWVDEDAKDSFDLVNVVGGTKKQE